jgi:membrane protein YdbS with pleckstrin-like domain
MESGWDPEVKKYFRRIINTIALGLLWLIAVVFAGVYHKFAFPHSVSAVYVILFYTIAVISFFFLLRYYYRLWRK